MLRVVGARELGSPVSAGKLYRVERGRLWVGNERSNVTVMPGLCNKITARFSQETDRNACEL